MSIKTLSPLILALIAQLSGGVLGLMVWRLSDTIISQPDSQILHSLWFPAIAAGIGAALVGRLLFRLPTWWTAINVIFIPATLGAMALDLPAWVYLMAFVLTLTVFWNVRSDRVPLYLTNSITWQALSDVLENNNKGKFIDLGCGLSGAVRFLARQHPDMTFVGVESAPGPILISKIRQWFNPLKNLSIIHGDIWNQDLSGYDAAYSFLSPAPMARLYEKAKTEMPKESLLISNSFDVPDHPPDDVISVKDKRKTRLLIWCL